MPADSGAVAGDNHRILIVDDNETIHGDFKKILSPEARSGSRLDGARAALFGESAGTRPEAGYQLDSAFQGAQALELVRAALREGRPYALAFVDVRMPPGWDGVETIERIWAEYPDLEVVICTAYSDYSWDDIVRKLGRSDRLLILKKPFDSVEVRQLACALTAKWKLAQQARLKLADLERFAQQRSSELSALNDRLREAKVAADSASRAKDEFLANISHEIRTPMTAILGHADLLLDPDQSAAERSNSVRAVQRNGQHLLELINDVLDLSKIESGMMPIEKRRCNPAELLADLSSLMQLRAREKGLTFDVRFGSPIPEQIETDPTRLRQILINLVGNAIKFTRTGGVVVSCRLETVTESERPRLRFDVVDTGIGMTDRQMARLFQPFVQADASTSRTFGGTGLGLSISQRLAHALGGEITVNSRAGAGTTFSVAIATGSVESARALPASITSPGVPPASVPATATLAGSLSGRRILVAEDGPDNQYLISFHLQRAGATVEIVENGMLAVEKVLGEWFAERPYDVVLMDMQMPQLDGYAATAALRRAGYRQPVVALTAHAMSGDQIKCLKCGCDAYSTKPLDPPQLIATVAVLAQQATADRAIAQCEAGRDLLSRLPELLSAAATSGHLEREQPESFAPDHPEYSSAL